MVQSSQLEHADLVVAKVPKHKHTKHIQRFMAALKGVYEWPLFLSLHLGYILVVFCIQFYPFIIRLEVIFWIQMIRIPSQSFIFYLFFLVILTASKAEFPYVY